MHYFLWLAVSAALFTAGEYWSNRLVLDPTWRNGALATAYYLMGSLAWLPAIIQKKNIVVAGTIWSVLTLLATVCVGLAFGEHFTWRTGVGLALGVSALVVLAG